MKKEIYIKKNFPIQNSFKGIILTNSAVNRFFYLIKKNPNIFGFKIEIKKSGCAGLTYSIKKVNKIDIYDKVYKKNGVKIYVSLKNLFLIDGTKIDYVKKDLNKEFKFYNPKANKVCGCGISFNI